jgi:hypothetical protein
MARGVVHRATNFIQQASSRFKPKKSTNKSPSTNQSEDATSSESGSSSDSRDGPSGSSCSSGSSSDSAPTGHAGRNGKFPAKLTRSNSTSSLYSVTGTIAVPDEDAMLRSIATILCQMIEETASSSNLEQQVHSQASDPFYCPSNTNRVGVDHVYQFLRKAFSVAQWSPECNVYALVLVTRMHRQGFPVSWKNWNRVMVVGLLMAQKMWDDVPLTNLDFPQLWRICAPHSSPFTALQLSHMEFTFMKVIKWEAHVTREVYTQFFYELRALAQHDAKKCGFASRAQTDKQMVALEVTSQQANPSSHLLHDVFKRKREACLAAPHTGPVPLRALASKSIKVLS